MKNQIIRVSITLLDVDPAIWRTIEVPANHTLEGLHDVIQIVMGWADCHLHHFQFGDVMYGVPTPEDREMNDGRKIKLSTALVDGERAFQYLYDYGDGWCCIVVLEAVAPGVPGVAYPRHVEGARRGPPEDGGHLRGAPPAGSHFGALFTSRGPDDRQPSPTRLRPNSLHGQDGPSDQLGHPGSNLPTFRQNATVEDLKTKTARGLDKALLPSSQPATGSDGDSTSLITGKTGPVHLRARTRGMP